MRKGRKAEVVDYDPLNDSLFISTKGPDDKVQGSIVFDSFSLDFTTEGKIVGLEIIGVSEYLKEWDFNPKILKNIKEARLIVRFKKKGIIAGILINKKKIPIGHVPIEKPLTH